MTREEIEKLAKQIVNDVEGVNSYERSYGYVTEDLVALVRATLEEAARAVCSECRKDSDAPTWDKWTGWRHRKSQTWCSAEEIHDLIAALLVEGS